MSPQLSIIMPCYNCKTTIEQAVASCFTQGFSETDFEIVMVDDGSTDGTKEVLQKLVTKHANIRLVFHEINQGGGAARNTAVANTHGAVIFCLDSDDALPPLVLPTMLAHLHEHNDDGVLFAETKFFTTDISQTQSVPNVQTSKKIILEDLFKQNQGFLTQVNFMYTKKAFMGVGGYTTTHGFDTQAFGLAFLGKKLSIHICPDTFYYHRQNQYNHKSYYVREYEQGLISINSYLALEPIIEYLHPEVITFLIQYDIFKKNTHKDRQNLRTALSDYIQEGNQLQRTESTTTDELTTAYVRMCEYILREQYDEATTQLAICRKHTAIEAPLLHYMHIRIEEGRIGTQPADIHKNIARQLHAGKLLSLPKYRQIPPLLKPLYTAYTKLFK
jgi:glycosyltransferase involved in cell wall biosynthesis